MVKIKHRFNFNEVKDHGLAAYCDCGYKIGSRNVKMVYALCFSHLDKQE